MASKEMEPSDPMAGTLMPIRRGVSLQVAHAAGPTPALVFLHGALGQRFHWRSQFEHARRQGWQALAYDLGGHGQSSPYPAYSIGRHGRDLRRLLHHLAIEAPILCAHSYGVPIALEVARRSPVRGLVLVAGGTHNLDPWWEQPLMHGLEGVGRHLAHAPWLQKLARHLSSAGTSEPVERLFRESPLPSSADPYRSLRAFWGYDAHRRPERDRWRSVPTLVVSGGRDPVFSREMGETLAAQFGDGSHHHIEEGGHLLMAERPQQLNQLLDNWLSERQLHPFRGEESVGPEIVP